MYLDNLKTDIEEIYNLIEDLHNYITLELIDSS